MGGEGRHMALLADGIITKKNYQIEAMSAGRADARGGGSVVELFMDYGLLE